MKQGKKRDASRSSYETDHDGAGVTGCEGDRDVQLKRFRMSVAGVASAGCFGSTRRLRDLDQLSRVTDQLGRTFDDRDPANRRDA
jgi:hypothetical protein